MLCGRTGHGKRQAPSTAIPTEPTTKRPHTHKPTHAHHTKPPSPNHYFICEKQ